MALHGKWADGDLIFYDGLTDILRIYNGATDGVAILNPTLPSPAWDDLRAPALSFSKGGINDPNFVKVKDNGAASTGVYAYAFDKAAEEELFLALQLPHAWSQGSDLHAHVHWSPVATAGGAGTDVCWGIEYTWANINGTLGNTTIAYGDEQTNGATETMTADKHYLTEIGVITGTGYTLSSMLLVRVFRDATGAGGTDDYDNDAVLLEFDIHYQIDALGSRQEYVK